MTRDPQDVAEAHRRYQLNAAHHVVERLADVSHVPVQDTASMRLALVRLMVGSHAHRRPLEHERTP